MKKTLLSLGLLGLAFQGFAQQTNPTFLYAPRFEEVNMVNSLTPPDNVIEYINTLSPTLAWFTMYDNTATTTSTAAGARALTTAPAGTQFDYFAIARRNDPGYFTSNISGIDDMKAVASTFGTAGGGEILRTLDGGLNWTRATTAAQFTAPDGFNNFVHMFNTTDGVSFGDPNGGSYEVLVTSDGGATWARNTAAGLVPSVSGEYGLTRAFAVYGNTIWAAGGVQANSTATPPTPGGISRIFKNTNKGVGAWTAVTLPASFLGTATDIAFYDANHGIAMGLVISGGAVTGVNRAITTDGGATWTAANLSAPSPNFYITGIDATQGKFVSYGRNKFTGNVLADFGYSYSTDGLTWTSVQTSCPFISLDLLDADGQGFAGYITDAVNNTGGIFKTTNLPGTTGWQYALGTRKVNTTLQQALSVYPNPSAGGNFTMKLNSGVKAGTQVVVYDVVGRQVYSRTLNATAVNAQSTAIDLSQQKAGVYTLELRTNEGTAQQKLVVE